MSHTGMARAIRLIHTPVDGDVIFVVSTNTFEKELNYREINEIGELGARVCSHQYQELYMKLINCTKCNLGKINILNLNYI